MIIEYHRPDQLKDALSLLARLDPHTLPIGGGTSLDRFTSEPLAVVDLQALGINQFRILGNTVELGATLNLEELIGHLQSQPVNGLDGLISSIKNESSHHIRHMATVAGTLMAADGRSEFTTAMLALDSTLIMEPGKEQIGLGDILPVRMERLSGRLITKIVLPRNARLAHEKVARSPADRPIVCAAVAVWPSGRTRVSLGGFGSAPILAFDGGEADGAEKAARSAYSFAEDQWASAEFRSEVAAVLTKRAIQFLASSRPGNE